jgi:PAS domain S-box-containing protein
MFGYTKNELRGKNVNMLIPSPVSQLHTGFIRNYVQSGVGKIIDKSVYQLVLCKDKRCVHMRARGAVMAAQNSGAARTAG